ncbi:hypothetical protein F4861DRAFT_538642 [Xylaria intraflava]|nr:hypothetical protein F4861DRAFT_538642 [Xylaria intraflava]
MTSSPDPAFAHDPSASDIYYPDDVFPQNSPLMKPCVPKLKPSPSPPAIPHIVSRSPRLGGKSSNRRRKVDPTRGDAVLIQHLDGGRRPEISQEAAYRPLDQLTSEDDGNETDGTMGDESGDDEDIRTNDMTIPILQFRKNVAEPAVLGSGSGTEPGFLRSLAENALAAVSGTADADDLRNPNREIQGSRRVSLVENSMNGGGGTSISSTPRPVLALPISPFTMHRSPEMYSPRQRTPSQVLMAPNSLRSPASLTPGNHDELAPIQIASPGSELSGHDPLPSIRSQVPELHNSPKELVVRPSPQFPHSPPLGPSPLGPIPGNHASPPVSPNERYRNSIPSPAKTLPALSPFPHISTHNNHQSPPGLDYNGSGAKLDRSSISQVLTPPTDGIASRMSITNVTHPAVGQFKCKFKGCTAAPFQTQYLLNSHANVHSTNRPHYCAVKGCPRGEGGQGFKRKNEMIRHGLVHDSPGHVRVHHVDKDKEDPLLREVLAHRPDGPNRGRRRRGVP